MSEILPDDAAAVQPQRVAYLRRVLSANRRLPPQIGTVLLVTGDRALVRFDREDTERNVPIVDLRVVAPGREAAVMVANLNTVATWPPGCRCYFAALALRPGLLPVPVLVWDRCSAHPEPAR